MEMSHEFAPPPHAAERCPCCGRRAIKRRGLSAFVLAWIEANLGVSPTQMRSERHVPQYVEARAMAVWALRRLGLPLRYADIARLLGSPGRPRTQSAVRHWYAKGDVLRRTCPAFAAGLTRLAAEFSLSEENTHGLD